MNWASSVASAGSRSMSGWWRSGVVASPGPDEAVGVGAGLDDGAVEGEAVDDGGAEAGVGEGLGPAAEALVGRDRDAGFLFSFGQDLEQELGAAAAVPREMSRWDLPVPESPIRQSGWPLRIQSQLARVLARAALTAGLASKSKSASHFWRGNPAALAVLALGHEQLGEEAPVRQLVPLGLAGGLGERGADGGQAQDAAGGVDRGVGGLLGHRAGAGHEGPSVVRRWRSSWS